MFKGLGANTSSILSWTKHPPAPTALTTYSPSDNPVRDAEVPVILLTEATRLPKRSYNSASQATWVIDKLGSTVITPSLPKHEGWTSDICISLLASTYTINVTLLMAGAGQKSSYTLTENWYKFVVLPHATSVDTWSHVVCHSKTPSTIKGSVSGEAAPVGERNVAQGGFWQEPVFGSKICPPETSIVTSWGVTPLYKLESIPRILKEINSPAVTVVS